MAKLPRIFQKLFGVNAASGEIGVFGSLATGTPTTTTDPVVMQGSGWLAGWNGAVAGPYDPAMEDMNAFCYVMAYQIAYLMQAGIAEYEGSTIYYIGSMCQSAGIIYISKTDANTGNALTSAANWQVFGSGSAFRTVTTTAVAAVTDNILRADTSATGAFQITLPAVASALGSKITILSIADNGLQVTAKGNGSELIRSANTDVINPLESKTYFCNGVTWDIL